MMMAEGGTAGPGLSLPKRRRLQHTGEDRAGAGKGLVKNRLIAITVFFILGCLIMAAPIVMLFALKRMPNTFFWGIPIGILLGGLSWIYLSHNWDPVNLSFRQPKTTKQRNWGPTAFIVALVILRTIVVTYTEDGDVLLGSVIVFWLISTGFYMIFRAWWHHPH
jgi:hypothetical protein